MVEVSFNVDEPFWKKSMPAFKKNISKAAKETIKTVIKGHQKNLGVNFLLTSDTNIKLLNKKYRNKNRSTNVLSFPMNQKFEGKNYMIGDVAISLQKIIDESKKFKIQKNKYLSKIVIHGVLHLLGFDHQSNRQYNKMNKIEKKVFENLFCK